MEEFQHILNSTSKQAQKSKILNTELANYKHTHTAEAAGNQAMFWQTGIKYEVKLVNFSIILSKDFASHGRTNTPIADRPTEEQILASFLLKAEDTPCAMDILIVDQKQIFLYSWWSLCRLMECG